MVLDWQLNLGWNTSKEVFGLTAFLLVAVARFTDRDAIGSQYQVYDSCSDSIEFMSIEISRVRNEQTLIA